MKNRKIIIETDEDGVSILLEGGATLTDALTLLDIARIEVLRQYFLKQEPNFPKVTQANILK